MHADLVGSACFGFGFNESEWAFAVGEAVQDTKGSEGRGTVGMNGLFQINFGRANDSLSY